LFNQNYYLLNNKTNFLYNIFSFFLNSNEINSGDRSKKPLLKTLKGVFANIYHSEYFSFLFNFIHLLLNF